MRSVRSTTPRRRRAPAAVLPAALAPAAATALLLLGPLTPAGASPRTAHRDAAQRTVRFAGTQVRVPASWPVYRLSERPRMCVRLDRRAVYLGAPGPEQRCATGAIGRRRAIVIGPRHRLPRGSGVGRSILAGPAAAMSRAGGSPSGGASPPGGALASGGDYTGLGFDACAAPSSRSMSAWGSSPYRAVGIYIGGLNRACAQPNLTATWVREQIVAGWHLIPTYVGLQAPTSSCGSCAKLSPGGAVLQGTAAAEDAVAQARAVGIGPGSPIYFDMESYSRTASATNATMTFLSAWTTTLHAAGYESGVYSSSASGVADLSARVGAPYPLPDNLWIANWDGRKDSGARYVPPGAWTQHQLIHQYQGGHNESYGGVTINIDSNYVEGATVGAVSSASAEPRGALDSVSSPSPGQVRLTGWAFDPGVPSAPAAIRVYLGGSAESAGAKLYDLGQVATLSRPDVGAKYRAAGPDHGFDVTFPVVGSRRQRVCAYAVGPGSDASKLLGCRAVGIAVPLRILRVAHFRGGARVAVRCEWPEGVDCPGQILMRAPVWIGHGRRARRVRVALARRAFRLRGGQSHAFRVVLSRRGRQLVGPRRKVRVELLLAIPGGKLSRAIVVRP